SHRRRGRTTPVAEIDLGSVEDSFDDVFFAVDRGHLAQAMEQLAPRHREVLALREQDGWSYQRIADHYDVSLGTVEALLHRARKALRREFEKVAGDRRHWAGVPVLGWVLRRMQGLRWRAAELNEYASPIAVKVASVAFAVGTAGIFAPAGGSGATVALAAGGGEPVAHVMAFTTTASAPVVATGAP